MTRPARRAAGALAAMLLSLLPLSGTLGTTRATAAAGLPAPLVVTLSALRPVAPQPGQDVVLTGTVRNTTSSAVSDLALQPRIGGPVESRSEFDDYADDPTGDVSGTLSPLGLATPLGRPRLAGGASEPFRVTLPAATLSALLPTGSWQVRELGLVATGTTVTGGIESASLRTFLPWAPRSATGAGTPVQVAWVWPLVDRPHRAQSSIWLDDDLAPELGRHGRLGTLLAAARAAEQPARTRRHPNGSAPAAVPVTWAVDPLLVQDTTLMSKGYSVRNAAGRTVTGTGRAAATTWLAGLRAGLSNSDVIALPYADTDLVAAVRANLGGEAGAATAAGRNLLAATLPATSTLLNTAWPVNGFADQRTLDTLFSSGITSVLLSSDALPVIGGAPPETPSARTSVSTGNGLETILFDAGLTKTIDQGAADTTDSALDLQRFLAETLMIQNEAPSDPRSVVVAPDRRWQPSAGYADAVLADSGRVPWLRPVSLSTVLASPPYTKVTRGPLDYPAAARHAELRPSYLRQVRMLKSELVGFGTVLSAGTATVASYDTAVQRLLSSAYRSDIAARNAALSSVSSSLRAQMNQVRIATPTGSYVTLTSHNGAVPITLSNNLDTPVRVYLKVEGNQRLALANGGRTFVVIPANTQKAVNVSATAKTSGVFPLEVRLLTPGLRDYGAPVQLYVRSTAYGTITLVITAAATVALLIAVGIRLTRRALGARRAAAAGA